MLKRLRKRLIRQDIRHCRIMWTKVVSVVCVFLRFRF